MAKKKIVAYRVIDRNSDWQLVSLMKKCKLSINVLCYGLLKDELKAVTGEVVEFDGYCLARTNRTKKEYGFYWKYSAGGEKWYYYAYEI